MTEQTYYTLKDGNRIPVVGFGTWQAESGEIAKQAVKSALEAGYRHIDTAMIYGNEESVGEAIKESGIPRERLFITTKLWNKDHSYDKAKLAIDESLERLGLDYLDLYLIHWPNPVDYRDHWQEANAGAWKAMEEALNSGKVKSIGVSNFMIHHLKALEEIASFQPVVNQIYLNPSDQQQEIVSYCKNKGILLEAYSPLGTGDIFKLDELEEIAKAHGKTVAQVVLRWSLQKGFVPLPKSVTPSRIKENIELFDFELSEFEMGLIDALQGKAGQARNPDEVTF
ncbi:MULTISPECIES: aldo/keto reductase [Enterococcaceae]|uniref:aldo/keto reductase n=1 Tax=Enterococcaceae TaxID=81852 RepID=UPI000E48C5DD|nr:MULTISPECIES: aldo/keto reductase [Enterococcaceae]MCI0129944.1 aldo/keto reductase [Vagococcus sp. CY53-2]RGI30815.1 aldo/keto reductase [Melissococcus sp. OM08-11BH]UNM88792.1 aldo/keto reductase [Vagococcus sp. CY52-2]